MAPARHRGAGSEKLLAERGYRTPVERLLFALVANRALLPAASSRSKSWVADEAHVEGLADVDVHQLYRAMDFLLEAHDEIQREVFWSVANLFNLEVDLLFLDTTTAYFEIEGEDEDVADEDDGDDDDGDDEVVSGLRKRGHSKDSRPGLAQVVIGFAVTRDGIPGALLGVARQHARRERRRGGQARPQRVEARPRDAGDGRGLQQRSQPPHPARRR